MISAPSRYAHLPTKEDEYRYIINNIQSGMSVEDVDKAIANMKKKNFVKHHYRTNLKNLGIFTYSASNNKKKAIELNPNIYLYKKNIITLKELLKMIIEENEEIMYIKNLLENYGVNSYRAEEVAKTLNKIFSNRKYQDLLRWFRPISFLLTYVYLEETSKIDLRYKQILSEIQKGYFDIADGYGEPVSIEELEKYIIKNNPKLDIENIWYKVYSDEDLEYKLSFITLPSWFTNRKYLIINDKVFTHIRIKKNII